MEIMRMTLSTLVLENITKRLNKGMGRNRVLPYTYRIQMKMRMNKIVFTVSDGNVFYTEILNIPFEGDDQYLEDNTFAIDGDPFINLIKSTGVAEVDLVLTETSLIVEGKGKYTFELINEPFNMPDIATQLQDKSMSSYAIGINDIKLLDPVKSGLTSDAIDLHLLGYYLSENYLVTTSGVKLCTVEGLSVKIKQPIYLTQRYVDLLQMFDDEQIVLAGNEKVVISTARNKILYGVQHPGKTQFPNFKALLGMESEVTVDVEATYLQRVLNRLKIFNDTTVYLKTNEEATAIYLMADKKGDSFEEVSIIDCSGLKELTNQYNINAFIELLNAHAGETVRLGFDENSILVLTSEGVTQILAPIVENDDD